MKVAISTDNNKVAQHFGRCPEYTIAVIKEGELLEKSTLENPGHQPGFLPRFLADREVGCIISGGMGQKAQNLFAERGIETIVGVQGEIDEVLTRFTKGELTAGDDLCEH
ncbi:MAG: NifB/NifX family molybdenum-iron cluster-binding protein [Bacillota bacterium]